MKKILFGLWSLVFVYNALAGSTNEWMNFYDKLSELEEYILIRKVRDPGTAADRMAGPLPRQPAFQDLQSMMITSWSVALDHLDKIATNDVKKTIIILAGREIEENEYIDFLERLLEMTERGELDPQILKFATLVTTGSRRNIHTKNDTRVQAIVERVRELYTGPW